MARLAEDLLGQAMHLAMLDQRRPKNVNLRRAISAAYYGLFHLLVAESVHHLVPHGPLMDKVSRAYQHAEMRDACEQIARTPTPPRYLDVLGGPASAQLRSVAKAFVLLQEQRHLADYDVSFRPSRSEVLQLLFIAEQGFTDLKRISTSHEGRTFLVALAFAKRWDRNR